MSSSDPAFGRRLLGLVVGLALAGSVAGCGFRPLYAPPGDAASPEARAVAADLASVQVAPIPNRQGQELRNKLTDMLQMGEADGSSRYLLSIGLGELQQSLAIRQTGLATRANLYMNATYSLIDVANGQPVLVGMTSSVASYDLLDEDFATLTAINDARTRVIGRLADNIRNRLAFHFAAAPVSAATPTVTPEPATMPPGAAFAPSPATEPTIAIPAPAPFATTQPLPAGESAAPVGPAAVRPGPGDAGLLP
jgi:LPS-assembly lipoprotein